MCVNCQLTSPLCCRVLGFASQSSREKLGWDWEFFFTDLRVYCPSGLHWPGFLCLRQSTAVEAYHWGATGARASCTRPWLHGPPSRPIPLAHGPACTVAWNFLCRPAHICRRVIIKWLTKMSILVIYIWTLKHFSAFLICKLQQWVWIKEDVHTCSFNLRVFKYLDYKIKTSPSGKKKKHYVWPNHLLYIQCVCVYIYIFPRQQRAPPWNTEVLHNLIIINNNNKLLFFIIY